MSGSGSDQRFADYFVVCGLDTVTGLEPDQLSGDSLHISPLQRSYKAKVLAHYPANVEWNPFDEDAVRLLSLPQGLHFKKQSEPHDPSIHSFLITREDGTRIYGCTLTFYEKVENKQICEAMQTLHAMHEAELNIARSKSRMRSRSPVPDALDSPPSSDDQLDFHFELQDDKDSSTFNLKNDVLMVTKCVSIILPLPFVSACGEFLKHLYEAAINEELLSLPLESYIYNLLFEVPLPPPGRTMRFKAINEDITCQRPGPNELPLFDYSLKELFLLLGVENIIEIFTCVLLEYQILLLSKSYQKFMLVAESITNLIFPFVWQHVYVPILPASLKHFLDAPVPFLMGLYCETEKDKQNLQLPSEASLCLIDIENCQVTPPEDLPEFPNKQDLIHELKETIEKFNVPSGQETPLNSRASSEGNSLENSIEVPQIRSFLSSAGTNNSVENESGSPSESPRNSASYSPNSRRKMEQSPRGSPRDSPRESPRESPNLSRRDKPVARVRPRRTSTESRAIKSKSATSLDLSKNPRLQAIAAIAERTGIMAPISSVVSNLEKSASDSQLDSYSREEEEMYIFGEPAKEISRKQQHENEFNTAIREIFANRFTQLLLEYESFVIQPTQDFEQWTSNREQMQNFDKASFLSDQPTQFLPFLSPFTETQMFSSFIDMKILANWEECDASLAVFDQRVENMKNRLGVVRSPSYEKCMSLKNSMVIHRVLENGVFSARKLSQIDIQVLLKRSNSVDYLAVPPHNIYIPKKGNGQQLFMNLHNDTLSDGPQGKGNKVNWKKRSRKQRHSEHVLLNTSKDGKKMRDKLAISLKKFMQESKTKTSQSQLGDMAALEATQNAFIQKLLKECRQKTKRMLVQKMGQEAVDLGHTDASVSGVEENTLIASLCDLLERVFSHGLQTKEGKSSLWSHLLAYQCLCESNEDGPSPSTNPNFLSPTPGSSKSTLDSPSKQLNLRRRSTGTDILAMMQPLQQSSSVLADMKHVQEMAEIKTDIGHARSWARLSLEKKVLSKHLKQVMSDDRLLRMRYKDYAFLRTEEEREQFLYHLLSLNAVDFFCFTNCFTSTDITYKVVIKTGKQLGGGSTTATAWMTLAGHLKDTGVLWLPKNENEFRFKHPNLGVLTTLRIGHDNTGLSPSWLIEQVVIKNDITEHIYRFPCGRWLAKNVDDGSTERLLVAELIKPKSEEHNLAEICRLSPQRRSPVLSRRNSERTRIPDVQEKMADSVNNIVKYFYKPDKERGNLTYLLCGDGGLCQALEQVFQCGFKSSRLFRNNFFIWDILEKAHQYWQMIEENTDIPSHLRIAKKSFCTMITRINNSSQTVGKDGKFQLFVCLGVRDHLLHNWLELISLCPAATNMYEPNSFLRDSNLVQFLVDVLTALVEFNITLEASLLKGIS